MIIKFADCTIHPKYCRCPKDIQLKLTQKVSPMLMLLCVASDRKWAWFIVYEVEGRL